MDRGMRIDDTAGFSNVLMGGIFFIFDLCLPECPKVRLDPADCMTPQIAQDK